jgi:hypothetical protein
MPKDGYTGFLLALHWIVIGVLWRAYQQERRRVVRLTDQLVEVGRETSLLIERITNALS